MKHNVISPLEESGEDRLVSRAACASVFEQVVRHARDGGTVHVSLDTWWTSELRWGRNQITAMGDRRDIMLVVRRGFNGLNGVASTNQLDPVSLEAVTRTAEQKAHEWARGVTLTDFQVDPPSLSTPSPMIWSDATVTVTAETRSKLARVLVDGAAAKGMLSAGYLEMRGSASAELTVNPSTLTRLTKRSVTEAVKEIQTMMSYATYTQAQCSMTVRHPKGTGSGWAGNSSYDWAQIDAPALAELALEKCVRSLDPVRIEPGRYTVVLEPQAVADLVDILMGDKWSGPMDRTRAESGRGPFVLGRDPVDPTRLRSRLGLRIIDDRITISHDPMHPQLGIRPQPGVAPITWIDKGVLQTLTYDRTYAVIDLNENTPALPRSAYRMSGGTTPVHEMIATTQRGLLVTRLSNITILDETSLLTTGVTRDGLWLIENGKIAKAVKNMRITESPLFVLNNVEQLGEPVPVFRPVRNPFDVDLTPALVPPLKVHDFSFTSTIDAI
jgi:predicted Zn-dependent protease